MFLTNWNAMVLISKGTEYRMKHHGEFSVKRAACHFYWPWGLHGGEYDHRVDVAEPRPYHLLQRADYFCALYNGNKFQCFVLDSRDERILVEFRLGNKRCTTWCSEINFDFSYQVNLMAIPQVKKMSKKIIIDI